MCIDQNAIFQPIGLFVENTSSSEKVSISEIIKENSFICKGKLRKNLCKHWGEKWQEE